MPDGTVEPSPLGIPPGRRDWILVPLALIWIIPGLLGHEPWKPDEGYTIGMVMHIVESGDWVVPMLAGEPFMEKPPLFYGTAALLARAFSPWFLPVHQAMALAAALYMALTVTFTFLAGREVGGREAGLTAALGLLGCLGLVVRAHSAITDTALWTGFAVACYGVFLAERRLVAGAFWFGTGTGLAFMAKGFMGPAFLGVATLLLPVVCPVWRRFAFCRLLLWTLLFALPWLVVWPTALYLRSPELFRVWFLDNNVGRFLGPGHGFPTLVQTRGRAKYLVQFPWFMLPLWPPALVAWWRHGRREWQLPRLLFPTLVVVVGYGILAAAAGQRDLYPIPLIVPLALLAAQGCPLPGWLDRVLRQGFRIASGAALALAWCLWLGWRLGLPPVADRIDAIAPGLQNHTGVFSVAAAVLVTAAWVGLFVPVSPFRQGWAWVWAGGMAAVWGTTMLLFLPVLNHRNGYRTTFAAMIEHLPDQAGPIANHRLGESQRAILDYYFRVRTQQLRDRDTIGAYRYLLVQDHVKYPEFTPEGSWRLLWQGSRPGDERELYLLYENTAFPVGPPAVDQPADEGKGS